MEDGELPNPNEQTPHTRLQRSYFVLTEHVMRVTDEWAIVTGGGLPDGIVTPQSPPASGRTSGLTNRMYADLHSVLSASYSFLQTLETVDAELDYVEFTSEDNAIFADELVDVGRWRTSVTSNGFVAPHRRAGALRTLRAVEQHDGHLPLDVIHPSDGRRRWKIFGVDFETVNEVSSNGVSRQKLGGGYFVSDAVVDDSVFYELMGDADYDDLINIVKVVFDFYEAARNLLDVNSCTEVLAADFETIERNVQYRDPDSES